METLEFIELVFCRRCFVFACSSSESFVFHRMSNVNSPSNRKKLPAEEKRHRQPVTWQKSCVTAHCSKTENDTQSTWNYEKAQCTRIEPSCSHTAAVKRESERMKKAHTVNSMNIKHRFHYCPLFSLIICFSVCHHQRSANDNGFPRQLTDQI